MSEQTQKPRGACVQYGWISLLAGAGLFCVLTFGGVMDALAHPAGWRLGALLTLLMTGVLFLCAHAAKGCGGRFAAMALLSLAALAARIAVFDVVTSDYISFLAPWVDVFREGGFQMLASVIGDYNLPYQYILALIAQSSIHDLYLIKFVSIIFDYALALMMYHVTERFIDTRFSLPVFAAVLFLPTVLLNGAYWAQCDALYVFFVVASLYLMLCDRPVWSVVSMAIAFSFKLQTIFFFPMALFGLLHRKYKLRHALVFPLTYLCTLIPALALGRSLSSALMVYVKQSMGQYYDALTYNAGNFYQFFPSLSLGGNSGYRSYILMNSGPIQAIEAYLNREHMANLQMAALIFCVIVVLAVVAYLIAHRKELDFSQVWGVALFSALFIPFVMPKMHDRYFFMADMFALLYAARHPRRWWIPVCVTASSFICYTPFLMRQWTIPLQVAALLNLAAIIGVAKDVFTDMRAHALCEEAKD